MTRDIMETLRSNGWYLSEQGYSLVSDNGGVQDEHAIVRRALEFDLREIGSGEADVFQGNVVLQIQKVRNVAAPKNNPESRVAPPMLKLSLTDGRNNVQAIEMERIKNIDINTAPGTKIYIKSGPLASSHGIILLKSSNVVSVIGGKVASLMEKWELNKKLASHSRTRPVEEGGPPPWIPFGMKIIKVTDQDRNFKALAEKEKSTKENQEFEAQRKDAIAEAAKQGSKKVFGGGNKQLLDHNVRKIVDQGFTIEQAEYALKVNRNNTDKALKSLQQRADGKHNTNERAAREPREPRGKRFEKKAEDGKPSSGKISLFDFLEDKLPAQLEVDSNVASRDYERFEDRYDSKNNERSFQSGRGGRSQKGSRNYPGSSKPEDSRNKRSSNNPAQYPSYGSNATASQSKPPRFQRNQETHNYYYQQDNGYKGAPRVNATSEHRSGQFGPSRGDYAGSNDSASYQRSQTCRDDQGKVNSYRHNHAVENENARNRHPHDVSYGRHRAQQDAVRGQNADAIDKNYDNPLNRYQPCKDNRAVNGGDPERFERFDNGHWEWKVGDRCLARYWEDNLYYIAVVTAVSDKTCVVQFTDFSNYEEVLQDDCMPLDDSYEVQRGGQDAKRQDHHSGRQQRYDQAQNHIAGMEFRRSGGSGGAASKGYNKKRSQQRSSQPIYQPPAQRGHTTQSAHVNHPL